MTGEYSINSDMEDSESEVWPVDYFNEEFIDYLSKELETNPYANKILNLFKSKVLFPVSFGASTRKAL